MLPTSTGHYEPHHMPRDIEKCCKGSKTVPMAVEQAHIADRLLSQFCARVVNTFSAIVPSTSLPNHIIGVLLDCSKPQMIGTDTSRNVAGMTDQKAIRNRTVMDFVGEAVSECVTPSNAKKPVSLVVAASKPQPTGIRFLDSAPKPLMGIVVWYSGHAGLLHRLDVPRALAALRGFVMPQIIPQRGA